jgi:hypothetical protein
MTTYAPARSTKRWDRRGKALRYRWYERCSDWLGAGRDAKADVVTLDSDIAKAADTPHIVRLGQLGRGWAERERVAFQAETADLRAQRAKATARRDEARRRIEEATKQAAAAAQAGPGDVPAPGEEDADESVRLARRRREHRARQDELAAITDRHRKAAAAADGERDELGDLVAQPDEIAATRVEMIDAYVRRRSAAYLVRLARKHPQGARLSTVITGAWTARPAWLDDDPIREDED